jgi:hypothetical protein
MHRIDLAARSFPQPGNCHFKACRLHLGMSSDGPPLFRIVDILDHRLERSGDGFNQRTSEALFCNISREDGPIRCSCASLSQIGWGGGMLDSDIEIWETGLRSKVNLKSDRL